MCWIEELWWEGVGKILIQIKNKNGNRWWKGLEDDNFIR